MNPTPASDIFKKICNAILEDIIPQIEERYVSQDKEVPPQLAMGLDDGSLKGGDLPIALTHPSMKDMLHHLHQKAAQHEQVIVAVLILESWFITCDKDSKPDMSKSLADHPDRKEAVIFNFISREGEQIIAQYEIDRTTKTMTQRHMMDPAMEAITGRFILTPDKATLN